MAQYINKDVLAAKIKRKIKEAEANCGGHKSYDEHRCNACIVGFYEEFLEILDTLEVKEVDDEKCKEYDKALSIAKAWYKSSDSSAQERNVARMIMGDKVREEL